MAMASPQISGDLSSSNTPQSQADERRKQALADFQMLLVECREKEVKLKDLRMGIREFERQYTQSEHDIQALQSVGQIIGEVLKELDGISILLDNIFAGDRFIVKTTNGPRYIVGCRAGMDRKRLQQGTRVALDMTTLTIMRRLPREVDPLIHNMSIEDPGDVTFEEIGGLAEQVREIREVFFYFHLPMQ
jgi:26S proteasome regulatory subunit T4